MPRSKGEIRLHHLGGPPQAYVLRYWDVTLGDKVVINQRIAVIETESFTMDVCSFDEGAVAEMNAIVGKSIPDHALIARIAVLPGDR